MDFVLDYVTYPVEIMTLMVCFINLMVRQILNYSYEMQRL